MDAWNFSPHVQLYISRVSVPYKGDIEVNMRREVPYLLATMYHCVHYMNTTTRSGRYSCFTKRIRVIVSIAKPNNYGLETVLYEAKLRAVLKIFENKTRTNSL